MAFALKRYEQDLEQRKRQREADLKDFKDKVINDELSIQKDRDIKKAKQLITNDMISDQIKERQMQKEVAKVEKKLLLATHLGPEAVDPSIVNEIKYRKKLHVKQELEN